MELSETLSSPFPAAAGFAHSLPASVWHPAAQLARSLGLSQCVAPAQCLPTGHSHTVSKGSSPPSTVLLTCSDVFSAKSLKYLDSCCCPQCSRAESLASEGGNLFHNRLPLPTSHSCCGGQAGSRAGAHPTPVHRQRWQRQGAAPGAAPTWELADERGPRFLG